MPELQRTRRWFFVLGMLFALSVVVVVLSILGYSLRSDLNRAQAAELEEQAAGRFAEVAGCYASARGRPRLIVILRSIGGTLQTDPIAREAIQSFIDDYEASTPRVMDCDKLARRYGLNPADFPPPTRRGEEGK